MIYQGTNGTKVVFSDGEDEVCVWVDNVGVHTQRTTRAHTSKPIEHKVETISIDRLVNKAEGQQELKFIPPCRNTKQA